MTCCLCHGLGSVLYDGGGGFVVEVPCPDCANEPEEVTEMHDWIESMYESGELEWNVEPDEAA
jgi:hypothetical protein